MNYFEELLNKSADIQLIEEKLIIKRRSINTLKELRERLIQIGEIEKENTEVQNELLQQKYNYLII